MVTLKRAYTPIDSAKAFDNSEFKDAYEKVNSLENILQTLTKNPQDFDAIDSAGAITMGNSNFYNQFKVPGKEARNFTAAASTHGRSAIDQYSINNADGLYGNLESKEKEILLFNSKVINSGDDVNYKTFAGLINLDKDMSEMSKDTPTGKTQRANFVAENSQYSPEWLREIQNNNPRDNALVMAIFQEYKNDTTADLQKIIFDNDGNKKTNDIDKFSDINLNLHKNAETKDYEFFGNLQGLAYSKL